MTDGTTDAGAGATTDNGTDAAAAAAKTASDVETARVAALTPAQKLVEEKAANDKADAETVAKAKADADAKAKGEASADYTALKMPEGYKTDSADPVFGEALKIFGDNKIAPDVAQKLLDFTVNRDKEMAKGVNDANATNWNAQADGWKAATAKQFSAEDLGIAKTAFEKVFDPETAKYLEALRYTDHPGIVAGMVKIGKAIKDDTFVAGNAGANGTRDARANFPNSNMNP